MSEISSKLSKSPFVGFTVEEVLASEACTYTIQVGHDFYCQDGTMFFTRKTAITYYNRILEQIVKNLYHEDEKIRAHAHRVIRSLKILPLRIN